MQFIQLGAKPGDYLGDQPDPNIAQNDDVSIT
jgi:hypothetical protein